MMSFSLYHALSTLLALLAFGSVSGDVKRRSLKRTKKNGPKPPPSPGFCGQTLFIKRSEIGAAYRMFEHGNLKFGAVECNAFDQCVGDLIITEPIPLYSNRAGTNKVGKYMSTQHIISVAGSGAFSDNHLVTMGEYTLMFGEGAKVSEVLYGGEQTLDEEAPVEDEVLGDFVIYGGVGEYVGINGDVTTAGDGLEVDIVDIQINCV